MKTFFDLKDYLITYKCLHDDKRVVKKLKQDKCSGELQIVHWQWSKVFRSLYTTIIINIIIRFTWHPPLNSLSYAWWNEQRICICSSSNKRGIPRNAHCAHVQIQNQSFNVVVTTQNIFYCSTNIASVSLNKAMTSQVLWTRFWR